MSCTIDTAPLFDWDETTCSKTTDTSTNTSTVYRHEDYFENKITAFVNNIYRIVPEKKCYYQSSHYGSLLHEAFLSNYLNEPVNAQKQSRYIITLYQVMLYTRDIVHGMGEYKLFYEYLAEWVKLAVEMKNIAHHDSDLNEIYVKKANHIHSFANKAIYSVVHGVDKRKPYGSWKDIKYFLTYLRGRHDIPLSVYQLPIFTYIIQMVVNQLRKDVDSDAPTLLAKWLPREKSKKFGWLAKHFAYAYYSQWLSSGEVNIYEKNQTIRIAKHSAERKCLTYYRRLLAGINRRLNTVQINQCSQTWNEIDFSNSVSSTTLVRQRDAFQYRNKSGYIRGNNIDRIICKTNYDTFVENRLSKQDTIDIDENSKSYDMTRTAMRIIDNNLNRENSKNTDIYPDVSTIETTLNKQWKDTGSGYSHFKNCIPVIDTSISMEGVSLVGAMCLGCRILDQTKDTFAKRRMITFGVEPTWHSLAEYSTVTGMVKNITTYHQWNTTTNIISTMKLILEECKCQELSPDEVSALTMVFMTDTTIENADHSVNAAYAVIEEMFKNGGLATKHAVPYPVPHIVYWDMRTTRTIPTVYKINDIKIINGFTPQILDSVCENTVAIHTHTPWTLLQLQLTGLHRHYAWVEDLIHESGVCEKTCIDEEPMNIDLGQRAVTKKSSGWTWW